MKTRSPKAPTRRRGRERVETLLAAASAVFAEKGYDGATMTGIAERAGASIGSLYQYFPTKEDVAAAIHARGLDQVAVVLQTLVEEADGMPLGEAIDALFDRFVAFLGANPAFVVVGDRKSIRPEVKTKARTHLRGLIGTLFAETDPPLSPDRRELTAATALYLFRLVALVSADEDPLVRDGILVEIRRMIKSNLEAGAALV